MVNAMTNQQGADWAIARIGQSIDTDNNYGAQCKDFISEFCQKNFGFTPPGHAKELINYNYPAGWQKIKNSPDFIPSPGDIAVWTGETYGHTGIIISANINNFVSVDQNWYNANDTVGSPAAEVQHNYSNYGFWGVIRPLYDNGSISNGIDLGSNFYGLISSPIYRGLYLTNDSPNVSIKTVTYADNQVWQFVRQSDGSYEITSCLDGKCLDVYTASSASGTNIQTFTDNDSIAQRWVIKGSLDNYTFTSQVGSCVMDISGAGVSGNNIQLWTANQTNNQRFAVEKCSWTNTTATLNVNSVYDEREPITISWSYTVSDPNYWLVIYQDGVRYKTYADLGKLLSFTLPNLPGGHNYYAYIEWYSGSTLCSATSSTFNVKSFLPITFDKNGGTLDATIKASTTANGINIGRAENFLVVYNNSGSSTGTNIYGKEVIVDATDKVTGIVTNSSAVPSVGFVLSGHGTMNTWITDNIVAGNYVHYNPSTLKVSVYATQTAYLANSKEVVNGKTYGSLLTPSRTGYSFAGWYTATSGGTKIDSTTIVSTTVAQTLYAHWTANTYTITFNSQGGTSVASKSASYNTTITAPTAPTKTGYTLAGWYKESACTNAWNFSTNVVTANTTLYAKWVINTYAVTYNSQGGSTVTGTTASYNTKLTAPTSPTKTGYAFGGWYKESSCTNAWNFSTDVVTAAITLYAKWTINTYAVTYNSQGGSAVTGVTANYNTKLTAPTSPTKTGYTFGGWYKDASCTNAWNFLTDVVTTATTLYAKWIMPFSVNATYTVDNGVLNVNAMVKNNNIEQTTVSVIMATYENSGKMLNMRVATTIYNAGEEKPVDYSYACGDMSDKYFKIFVFDGLTNIKSLALSYFLKI